MQPSKCLKPPVPSFLVLGTLKTSREKPIGAEFDYWEFTR